ncbi:MAG TPA: efflux RND transporter permease subunit, partial [Humisphaera sp.]
HFLYINGIEHVESKSIQGVALIKLQFHPGTDMSRAMAETVSYVNRSRAFMPAGTIPPFIMRFDAGSVPVGNLVFTSDDPSLQLKDLQDAALMKVRPLFATLPGVSAPPPFGGSPRAIVIRVDPDKLRSLNMSPDEVVAAVGRGNAISPSGNVRVADKMPVVPINSLARTVADIEAIPVRMNGTQTVFVRDVGKAEDSADIQTGVAVVNGKRTVYIPVTKRADASTLGVVGLVKENLPKFQAALPPGVRVSYEFDQSPYVTRAIWGLTEEGALGAVLTGLVVLLFLRDWRSGLVVVLNIPLALLAAAAAMWATGQTVNVMTLGGLALAVGVLVDEATVTIENVHAHLARGESAPVAALAATRETALPRLLAMLCVLAVFIPTLFMQGVARSLFVPLALAVGFSMVASYLLSSTLVPVLAAWTIKGGLAHRVDRRAGAFDRLRDTYARVAAGVVGARWVVLPVYLLLAGGLIYVAGGHLGREIFPVVDAGQFTLRVRAPAGTRLERTEQIARDVLATVGKEAGDGNVALTMGFVGVQPGAYPVNTIHLWTSGPEEAVLQVQLKPGAVRVEELKDRLRKRLPEALPGVRFSFEPSDIVSRVMSFGSPTPVQVAVTGPDLAADRQFATKVSEELAKVPSLRDLQFEQSLDYPAIKVDVDRERAGVLGINVDQIARALTAATSSSRYTAANYWADPKSGIGYQVQVQVPEQLMNSAEEVRNVTVGGRAGEPVAVRQVADVAEGTVLGQYDRYNMQRMLTLTANVAGEDLGRVADRVERAVAAAGAPPGKVAVAVRGQVTPMRDLQDSLVTGMGVAVAVIFLLLAANFQSFRVALAVVLMVPAVAAGTAVSLLLTGTTLNVQSFMGAIMAIGVAVANAILLVTFAERARAGGEPTARAAATGAAGRLRPILMTTTA